MGGLCSVPPERKGRVITALASERQKASVEIKFLVHDEKKLAHTVVVYRIKRQHKGLHKGLKMEVPTILKVFCSKLLRYNELT